MDYKYKIDFFENRKAGEVIRQVIQVYYRYKRFIDKKAVTVIRQVT